MLIWKPATGVVAKLGRLVIIITNKKVPRAVDRNRIRRRIRGRLNKIMPDWRKKLGGVILADSEVLTLSPTDLEIRLQKILIYARAV